jgi:membrane protease YdiL (CAAX protease family)
VSDKSDQQKAQTRLASIVILVAMLGWMLVNFLGGKLGLPTRFAFLADFAAMAAFAWALIVLFKVWRQRQEGE